MPTPGPGDPVFAKRQGPQNVPRVFKKRGKPHPGFANLSTKNCFGLSDGHIGSSGGEIRGSRTNSAARTLSWACRVLGTSFSPLSTSGDLGPGPSPGPLGPYTTPDQPALVGQYVSEGHKMFVPHNLQDPGPASGLSTPTKLLLSKSPKSKLGA